MPCLQKLMHRVVAGETSVRIPFKKSFRVAGTAEPN
jgi:hypothetical protein